MAIAVELEADLSADCQCVRVHVVLGSSVRASMGKCVHVGARECVYVSHSASARALARCLGPGPRGVTVPGWGGATHSLVFVGSIKAGGREIMSGKPSGTAERPV